LFLQLAICNTDRFASFLPTPRDDVNNMPVVTASARSSLYV